VSGKLVSWAKQGNHAGGVSGESADAQLVYTTGIDEGIGSRLCKIRFDVADVAVLIGPGAEEFRAQAEVQREIASGLPVVLDEDGRIVLPIFVVINASPAETKLRSATDKVPEVGGRAGVCEK
jgi:hypothetical protein